MESYNKAVHGVLYSRRKEPEWFSDQYGIRAQKEGDDVNVSLVSTRSEKNAPCFLLHHDPLVVLVKKRFSEGLTALLSRESKTQMRGILTTPFDDWVASSYELQLLIYGSPQGTSVLDRKVRIGLFFDKLPFIQEEGVNFGEAYYRLTMRVNPSDLKRKISQIEQEKQKLFEFTRPCFEH